jgi:hypothetical protein
LGEVLSIGPPVFLHGTGGRVAAAAECHAGPHPPALANERKDTRIMATSDSAAAATSGQPFAGLLSVVPSLSQSAASIFGSYENAQIAKTAASKLNSNDLLYALLGLGGLAVLALVVLRHH